MISSKKISMLSWAHPLVAEWFTDKLGTPTEPQVLGWDSILQQNPTLISAPTGSGKTLAAFLICINSLIKKSLQGELSNTTEVLYISPLKALGNDIQKNLLVPLKDIENNAKSKGLAFSEIAVAVRSGDTKPADRQKMLKKPPHILVTTPESLYILLTAEKSRLMLQNVKTVIVDEIHALMNSKRGTHLSLSLERLEALTTVKPLRIGLSATQKPLDLVAEFLTGKITGKITGKKNKKANIVNMGHIRDLELSIALPKTQLGPVASNEMWDEIYDKIAELTECNRSILVFVNTRKLAERLAHHLEKRIGKDKAIAHHGSLSKKIRLDAENRLKLGELKILVATSSLELGIDIGSIDLVCQIGSPRAISAALQRIGRAGHWHGAISKAKFFATTRDELMECAALIYAIKKGELDMLVYPKEPLDILMQQIVATVSSDDWLETDLYHMITKAFPYQQLSYETFDKILELLAEGMAASRGRLGALVFRDKVNGLVKGRRGSRLTSIMNGGAIPENGLFTVITESENTMVGTLDEDFAVESNRGDIILLGTTSWRVMRVDTRHGKVLVENANGAPPSVPFWRGDAPGRTDELSYFVSFLRETLNDLLFTQDNKKPNIAKDNKVKANIGKPNIGKAKPWLEQNCNLDSEAANQLIDYLIEGRSVLGDIPTQQNIIAERFFDESGGMQLVIHAPFGMRINKAWGLALRKKFCRSFNFELQAQATDDGLNISLAEQHSFPLKDVFHFLHPNTLEEVLIQSVLQSPIFNTRWRWTAGRSLALPKFRGGKKIPPNIQRILSDDLLAAVFPDAAACQDNLGGRDIELPDHPLINETIKDILHDALDLPGLIQLLTNINQGKIQCLAVDTPIPSAFSTEILNANPYAFLDDAPLEERRARAVELRRVLPDSILQEAGKLDAAVIDEVQQQIWPDIRNIDELEDVLQSVIAFPESFHSTTYKMVKEQWSDLMLDLVNKGRAGRAMMNNKIFWFATQKKQSFLSIYPNATLMTDTINIETKVPTPEQARLTMIRGWLLYLGPTTSQELSDNLSLTLSDVEQTLLHLESSGFVLRGHFKKNITSEFEWCERRLLARIHQLTKAKLRKEIEPVDQKLFVHWLMKWQHITDDTQLKGKQGLIEVIRQLQGFEIPAKLWEKEIFEKRIKDYHKDLLDHLCLTGVIGWGRISLHPTAKLEQEETSLKDNRKTKRINATSIAPVTFFIREDLNWLGKYKSQCQESKVNLNGLSSVAKAIYGYLKEKGASFFSDIIRGVKQLESTVETGLWDLVAAGLISADSFDNLRAIIDPKRRMNKRARGSSIRFAAARWSLLKFNELEGNFEETLGAAPEENIDIVDRENLLKDPLVGICHMLFRRYGVVFRDLLTREKNIPRWYELLKTFRRLEERGEIRGGRFVNGVVGEQFALPHVIESLRAIRNEKLSDEEISLSPADPLNLVGILLPGARISSLSKTKITFKNGGFTS